ncbi:MAG TPA: PLP-dependent aminotransferase family protein [Bryobacteraceae bacterium]|nr:PLP-dependent aminotransferase family protein [Bryobacteraceae bacterium]
MFPDVQLDPHSNVPLYRQLYGSIRSAIVDGILRHGERIPATRELAGLLGLNRTTISAAYDLLESEGFVRGHVGRGSFVVGLPSASAADWALNFPSADSEPPSPPPAGAISFATARPSADLFPLDDFRRSCDEALSGSGAADILQLGSAYGYAPLREYLLDAARRDGLARDGDDLIITNGCQQALDLVQRVLIHPGDPVLVEDPVYPGLKNLFLRAGARLVGVPVGPDGLSPDALDAAPRARVLVTTPTFQNPTGATIPAERRLELLDAARNRGLLVIENDIYGDLRYEGAAVPPLKASDETRRVALLQSFSKITFPGLRVGWVLGPRALIARLAEAKQVTDLHSDQLSQAALLRFAESGRLAAHRQRVVTAGGLRLKAVLEACGRWLPAGSEFTRPEGGMNLWVRLPRPLDAMDLLARAHRAGVAYIPGRYFEVSRHDPGALRLSFAGLAPAEIRRGVEILGSIASAELERTRTERRAPAPALV